MKISVAQISTHPGDFPTCATRMLEYAGRAADGGCDLLVFPSMALCGAGPISASDREGFFVDLLSTLIELEEALPSMTLVPIISDLNGITVSEAVLIGDGQLLPIRLAARIGALPGAAEGEPSPIPLFEVAGARVGVAFTYEDLEELNDYEYGVDVIVFLSTYGFSADDPSSALGCFISSGRYLEDASTTGAWIVGVGSLGCYGAEVFCGSSFVLAPWGELAAQAPCFEEALLTCEIDHASEGPLSEPLTPEVPDVPLVTWGALSMGLADIVGYFGSKDVCLAVLPKTSSMLLAALATDSLGPLHVHTLVVSTGDPEMDGAQESLLRSLRIPSDHIHRFEASAQPDPRAFADLVQVQLGALARATGAVPLGAEDKTSLALERQDGVTAVQLWPFGDLYRSDVIALARMRNTISPVIPSSVTPSFVISGFDLTELGIATDEAGLKFVDLVLSSYIEWEQSLSEVIERRGHGEAVMAIVSRLRDLEQLRCSRTPVITLSSKTLAESRRSLGCAWSDHPRDKGEDLGTLLKEHFASKVEEFEINEDGHRRDVSDLLGFLSDFSEGGPLSGRRGDDSGQVLPYWEGPFSQN